MHGWQGVGNGAAAGRGQGLLAGIAEPQHDTRTASLAALNHERSHLALVSTPWLRWGDGPVCPGPCQHACATQLTN